MRDWKLEYDRILWYELTVLDRDLAITVFCTAYGLIVSSLLNHSTNCALAIGTVISWILAQLKC